MSIDNTTPNWKAILARPPLYLQRKKSEVSGRRDSIQVLNEGRYNRMVAFRNCVINPASSLLQNESSPLHDSGASVLVSGSAATWDGKKKFRAGSDVDFMVMSEHLGDPDNYAAFLKAIQWYDLNYIENTGVVPVYFTQASSESDVLYVAREYWERNGGVRYSRGEDHTKRYLPVHFLFYPGYSSYYAREPGRLANRLLESSAVISGSKQFLSPDSTSDNFTSMIDLAKWELERHLANLILNYHILPHAFVFQGFSDRVLRTVRGPLLLDTLYGQEPEASVNRTVELLDRDYSHAVGVGIAEVLRPLLDVHKNGWPNGGLDSMDKTCDNFIIGATTLMHLTDYLINRQST